MRKEIWKFTIKPDDRQEIEMPIGAEILTVQTQGRDAQLWALVNPNTEKEKRYFELFGTGHPVHCDMGIERKYINSFQLFNGTLVFHLFERID